MIEMALNQSYNQYTDVMTVMALNQSDTTIYSYGNVFFSFFCVCVCFFVCVFFLSLLKFSELCSDREKARKENATQ